MKRIRVLVANQPRLIRELIMTTIADQPDIELVGEVGNQATLRMRSIRRGQMSSFWRWTNGQESGPVRVPPGTLSGDEDYGRSSGAKSRPLYWAIVDIRSQPLESSEAGILNAMRQRPPLVGLTQV